MRPELLIELRKYLRLWLPMANPMTVHENVKIAQVISEELDKYRSKQDESHVIKGAIEYQQFQRIVRAGYQANDSDPGIEG